MREFIYGLIIGLSGTFGYHYFNIPGMVEYLNSGTESAASSVGGYGGQNSKQAQERAQRSSANDPFRGFNRK